MVEGLVRVKKKTTKKIVFFFFFSFCFNKLVEILYFFTGGLIQVVAVVNIWGSSMVGVLSTR